MGVVAGSPLIVVLPGIVAGPELESALQPLPAGLAKAASLSRLVRLAPSESGDPFLAFFGQDPDELSFSVGTALASAFRFDSPSGSLAFALSWVSVDEEGLVSRQEPSAEEIASLPSVFQRLSTPTFAFGLGHRSTHVMADLGGECDLRTTPLHEIDARYEDHLPLGDREKNYRQLIDDSRNILEDHEINRRRRGEGLPLLNLFWPWGGGIVQDHDNLVLRTGLPLTAISNNPLLTGMARGYGMSIPKRPQDWWGVDAADCLTRVAPLTGARLVLLTGLPKNRDESGVERAVFTLEKLSQELIDPALERGEESDMTLLFPGGQDHRGLGLRFRSSDPAQQTMPFDERILDEPGVPERRLHEVVRHVFASLSLFASPTG